METRDKLEVRENMLVHSEKFGRMGLASIRYCVRLGMKYSLGMQFTATFRLSDPVRKKILDGVVPPGRFRSRNTACLGDSITRLPHLRGSENPSF